MEQFKLKLKGLIGGKAERPPRFKTKRQAGRGTILPRPAPLGPRQRPLTPPHQQGSLHQQDQSIFFSQLPYDIRRLVYQYVLASPDRKVLHVASSWRRLLCHRCHMTKSESSEIRGWRHDCWGLWGAQAADGASVDWLNGEKPPVPSFMGILCSCRRIYTESIDILYSDNILNVRQTRTIVDLKATIPAERLHSIRSLQLDCPLETFWCRGRLWASETDWPLDIAFFWKGAWEAIADMKGLKSLNVSLSRGLLPLYSPDRESLVEIFEAMATVHVPDFQVVFFWHIDLDEILKKVGTVPFSIEVKSAA